MSSVKRLITEYWKSPSDIRNTEVLNCIKDNVASGLFNEIYVLTEDKNLYLDGVNIIKSDVRCTFQLAIDFINSITSEIDINIIANSDIQFDATINLIEAIQGNEYVCLTRYENGKIISHKNKPSVVAQDVWCFRGIIRIQNVDFYFGQPGCDNVFCYLAEAHDYKIKNWSLDIKTHHKHESKIRIGNSNLDEWNKNQLPMQYFKFTTPSKIS